MEGSSLAGASALSVAVVVLDAEEEDAELVVFTGVLEVLAPPSVEPPHAARERMPATADSRSAVLVITHIVTSFTLLRWQA